MHKKKILDLAIIIPTLNEEHFVGYLLDSIASQSVLPKEIVVVDAYSADKTVMEVRKRQKTFPKLRLWRIPKFTIARQRNFGVKKASANHILFLDADMEFKDSDALAKYINEVSEKKCDVAAATNLPNSKYWKDQVFFKIEDLLFKGSRLIWPVVTARNLFVRRTVFEKNGGFDEELTVGEDQELVQRVIRNGSKFIFLNKVSLYTSTRRVQKEGRTKYALKMIFFGLDIILKGRKKSNVAYEFGNFKRA